MIALVCAGLILTGDARYLTVSGDSFYNYMRPAGVVRMTAVERGRVYDDGGQVQITISRDRKRVWVQKDADDNPRDRGVELRCVSYKKPL